MQLRPKNITSIRYILVSSDSPFVTPLLPPVSLANNFVVDFIRQCPEDILQLHSPMDYHKLSTLSFIGGYDFMVTQYEHVLDFPNDNRLTLYFIDCDKGDWLRAHFKLSGKNNSLWYYCFFSNLGNVVKKVGNEISDPLGFLSEIVEQESQILGTLNVQLDSILPFVDTFWSDKIKYSLFSPSQTNFYKINALMGNYGIDISQYRTPELQILEQENANKNPEQWQRQSILVEQISDIDYFLKFLVKNKEIRLSTSNEPRYAPLILIFPFHNPSIKSLYGNSESIIPFLTEQTNNYISYTDNPQLFIYVADIIRQRLHFLDDVGALHGSFSKSPVIRMPLKGKSIYTDLSFVGPLSFGNMEKAKYRRKLKKLMTRIGNTISSKYMSPSLQSILENRNSQIVTISDLPIEWSRVNDVPLSFTHDICRLPETPMHAIMRHYTFNNLLSFSIPSEIIENTLVIFGCNQPMFQHWQKIANDSASELGFKTAKCLTLEGVKQQIHKHKPKLLIFDCHGEYDKDTKQTYLIIGNQRLTQDYIVNNNLHAPIVFISACGTTPTYSLVNPISNGFFETGSLSVTATYLPISIHGGSLIYVRLLQQLSMAAKQAIHKNWLNFVCHIIRTSVVHHMYLTLKTIGKITSDEYNDLNSKALVRSMHFEERAKLFKEIEKTINTIPPSEKNPFSTIIPEYLFYSVLGRADLILFDSWKENYEKKNEEEVENQQ